MNGTFKLNEEKDGTYMTISKVSSRAFKPTKTSSAVWETRSRKGDESQLLNDQRRLHQREDSTMYFVALIAPKEAKTESIEACQNVRKTTDWARDQRRKSARNGVSRRQKKLTLMHKNFMIGLKGFNSFATIT